MTSTLPTVGITPVSAPYWDALREGRLAYQSCSCGRRWLPPRAECPSCLGTNWEWAISRGVGRLVSWVVYHVAYHESFADRLPYNVAIVELDEGPRLITNVIDCAETSLRADAMVGLAITEEQGIWRAQFRLLPDVPESG